MNKKHVLLTSLSMLILFLVPARAADDVSSFTQQQVKTDLDILYQSLIDTHYNPYAYITPEALEDKYNSIKSQITQPNYSLLETIRLYQQLVSFIKNGHTEIDFPAASYLSYAENGGTVFPLDLAFENGMALVRANYSINNYSSSYHSKSKEIKKGAQLLAINGVSIDTILEKIMPQISAERRYFKLAKLEVLSFPRYYWYVFGQSNTFKVKLKFNGEIGTYELGAVPVFEGFEAKKDEILRAQQTLRFYENAAYLNPGHFSGDEQQYQRFIDDAFKQIKQQDVNNLIIDLRYNAGGNDSFSDYMVAYIADAPFTWHNRFMLRTSDRLKQHTKANQDLSNPYWRSIMNNKSGSRYKYEFQPYQPVSKDKRYMGEVYVLVNRHTHSQSSVTAAQIQDYGWATIIGEETGDYPTLFASQFHYALPNTQVVVKIAKGYIVRVNGSEAAHGVLPDIVVNDHLLDNDDEILQTALQLTGNAADIR